MLIEFTGCTGSGKSSILKRVREDLSDLDIKTISSAELILRSVGLNDISNPRIKNIILDLLVFPQFILSLRKNIKFCLFALKILFRSPDSIIRALNRYRSIIRKIGINELIRQRGNKDQIIIVDEGTVHAAHNIFVYSSFPIQLGEIFEFAELIPIPDVVICIDAPVDIILERTLKREDPPERISSKMALEKYINRARKTFAQLSSIDSIKKRLLTINVFEDGPEIIDASAKKIVDFLLGIEDVSKGIDRLKGKKC